MWIAPTTCEGKRRTEKRRFAIKSSIQNVYLKIKLKKKGFNSLFGSVVTLYLKNLQIIQDKSIVQFLRI